MDIQKVLKRALELEDKDKKIHEENLERIELFNIGKELGISEINIALAASGKTKRKHKCSDNDLNWKDYCVIIMCCICVVSVLVLLIYGLGKIDWNISGEENKAVKLEEYGPHEITSQNEFNTGAAIYDYMQTGDVGTAITGGIIGTPQTNVFDQ